MEPAPEQLPFQFEGTYSIDGYTPPFSLQDTLLNLDWKRVQVGGRGSFMGLGVYDDDDDRGEPQYEFRYSITILGHTVHGDHGGNGKNAIRQSDDNLTIAAKIANTFLDDKRNETKHPEVWAFLISNAKALNQSKRYWHARTHLAEIAKEEEKLAELQERIKRGKFVAQLKAFEVLSGEALEGEARERKWAEITGGLPYNL
jgi:hypothetical protein